MQLLCIAACQGDKGVLADPCLRDVCGCDRGNLLSPLLSLYTHHRLFSVLLKVYKQETNEMRCEELGRSAPRKGAGNPSKKYLKRRLTLTVTNAPVRCPGFFEDLTT